jgi:hypothetical protein
MSESKGRLSRRNFLLAAGAGTAAGAAALVAKAPVQAPAVTDKSKRATQGYAESQHIRDYYRSAKV